MTAIQSRLHSLVFLLCTLLAIAGCANHVPRFVPPDQRPIENSEKPWPRNHYLVLAYHDVEDEDPDQSYVSVRTDHLLEQFSWLRENGYSPITVDQIMAAQNGGPDLPDQAVLLTFDDGYRSFYTRVFPILKAFNWPAVLAPVGAWVETPDNELVDFGGKMVERERFLTWDQIAEVSRSGLVEVGAHTDDMHYGIVANPQGNLQPAAAARLYDIQTGEYENDADYERRVREDVANITRKIKQVTGKAPRVWVWPYGEASGPALRIVQEHGYQMALNLENTLASVDDSFSVPRLLISNDPPLQAFAQAVVNMENNVEIRVAHVDLDYVYDADPQQMERNLDKLVQRVADLGVNVVFLQAFADPNGDGLARELYFPNRHLPVRADLFSRAAWQLRSRALVRVFAWMPVLSFELDPDLQRVTRWDPVSGETKADPSQYERLSPFDPRVRQQVTELYEDLARNAIFAGILFHDDALLSDFEDASPPALEAYRTAGLGDSIEELRADPETLHRWTRFKSRYLVDFTLDLAQRVHALRGPQIETARNMFAPPIVEPASEAWFAQNLDDFLAAYDWTALMAMPWMEGVAEKDSKSWLRKMVEEVGERPGALDRTVFELQARDWRVNPDGSDGGHVDSVLLADWMRWLQMNGARNLGYYPDDFVADEPRIEIIRPVLSNNWYPFR